MDFQHTGPIIITGGSTSVARAIATAFARHGGNVVLVGRQEAPLRATTQMLGDSISYQQADVTQRQQVIDAVEAIVKAFGEIGVLVNHSGFSGEITTETELARAEATWDEELAFNLKGTFLMSMAVVPHLKRPGGRIINISSIVAFTGGIRPGAMGYAAAKAGVVGLTYSFARELSPQGITVNTVAPGFIADTEFSDEWTDDRIEETIAQTPVGRPGHVEDVAAATLYLASPGASFVSGEVLNVNGGWRFAP